MEEQKKDGGAGEEVLGSGTEVKEVQDEEMRDHDGQDEQEEEEGYASSIREAYESSIIEDREYRARNGTVYHARRTDDDTLNSTQSLYDTGTDYLHLYGRRYVKDYYFPVDEDEQTRLQMLNGVYFNVLGHRLTTVPLDNPQKILDVGTGTGEWAMSMGDEYPDCEVIGTDLARIQPGAAPLNVFFEIEDAEQDGGWAWPDDEFDLVHFRYLCGAFRDWAYIYSEVYRHLKPGGWVECIDFDDHRGLISFFEKGSLVPAWLHAIAEGSRRAGRPRGQAHLEPSMLTQQGFIDVSCTDFLIPMGTWPDNPEAQRTGKHFLMATIVGVEALCLRVLTQEMGWSYEEVQQACEVVRETVWKVALDSENAKGIGFRIKVLTGRKPGG